MNPGLSLWKQVLADPLFRDIPYKVETTRGGAILMSPSSNWHGSARVQVGLCLCKGLSRGEVITACSILTSYGVKVADVAWASEAFMAEHGYRTPYPVAPEICVEVVSPGNSVAEIEAKVNLYLAKGALEVWVVRNDGSVDFFDKTGSRPRSALVKKVALTKRQ